MSHCMLGFFGCPKYPGPIFHIWKMLIFIGKLQINIYVALGYFRGPKYPGLCLRFLGVLFHKHECSLRSTGPYD